MSSWKKAAKSNQKTHRERHQPARRAHLGLLEKKKDYAQRAADYDEKGRALRLLQRRALERNPDEFYHHMLNARLRDGEHEELTTPDEDTPEQVKLMQTQDIKYVNMKRTQEMRRVARLQAALHLTGAARANTRTLFLERGQRSAEQQPPPPPPPPALTPQLVAAVRKSRDKSYRELERHMRRERQLCAVQHKMELKRALRDPAARLLKPRRVQRGTALCAPVYRFQYQRKP